MSGAADEALRAVLGEARDLGLLGPGPIDPHVAGARALASVLGPPTGPVLDLGSGGGVPGLVLATEWADADLTLLDASARRCAFLRRAVERLGCVGRVHVTEGRAEDLAHSPALRGHFPVVVARAFGIPAVTAECAAGFLAPRGVLAVTEPPPERWSPDRWPVDGLDVLGLSPAVVKRVGATGVALMSRVGTLAAEYPRRAGIPAKRPLWSVGS